MYVKLFRDLNVESKLLNQRTFNPNLLDNMTLFLYQYLNDFAVNAHYLN